MQPKEVLCGVIGSFELFHYFRGVQTGAELQLRPEHFAQIAAFIPGMNATVVNVPKELAGPKPRLPNALDQVSRSGNV